MTAEDRVADISLSIHARREGDDLEAWVYIGSEVVFADWATTAEFPVLGYASAEERLEDFAAVAVRRFARKLAAALESAQVAGLTQYQKENP